MITMLFALDPLMHFIHVGGVGLSLGGTILLGLLFVTLRFKPKLAGSISSITPIIFAQIWLGLLTLGFSGLLLFLPRPWLAVEPLYILKMTLVVIVLVSGILFNLYSQHQFRKIAPEWAEKTPRVVKYQMVTAVLGFIFFAGLMGGGILSHLI